MEASNEYISDNGIELKLTDIKNDIIENSKN